MLMLETDLPVTAEDLAALRTPCSNEPEDLAAYLDFLEDVGAFDSEKPSAKHYAEGFEL